MNQLRERIKQISAKVLDATDLVLDQLTPPPPVIRPSVAVARRQAANTLRVWRFCTHRACIRARCCRGEPLVCLRTTLPLLPPELIKSLMLRRQPRRAS